MNAEEYVQAAQRTMKDMPSSMLISEAMLGIMGEAHEVVTAGTVADVELETGDMFWYMAELIHAVNRTPAGVIRFPDHHGGSIEASPAALLRHIGTMAELLKKHLYHEQPLPRQQMQASLDGLYSLLCSSLYYVGSSPEEAMRLNVEKLQRRHPEQFSTDYHTEAA